MLAPIDIIEKRLQDVSSQVKRKGDSLTACCPAHADRTPSLSVGIGTKGRDIVIHCHAGCSPDDVMAALDMKWTDLGPPQEQYDAGTVYTYTNASGLPIYRVHRGANKKFWQDSVSPHGEWVSGLGNTPRVLYHLRDVLAAVADKRTIWIAEGEKDVDRLRAEGVVATCNSGGAKKFQDCHADVLFDATVVIVADRDQVGYEHARIVHQLLVDRRCNVRVVAAAKGKDAFDHLAAGLPLSDFVTIDPYNDDPDVSPEPWPDPVAIGGGFDALPTFPVEILPTWIRDHVEQVANELQVPIDLPAMLALVALSTIAAKRAEVWVTTSWREQLCLYLVVALPPGAGKSPAFTQILGPLVDLEAQMVADARPLIEEQTTRRAVVEKLQRKAIDKGETTEALLHGDELRDMPLPIEPRLFVDDVTVEKLGEMLRDQNGRLALTSTEGGLFDQMVGRYSDKAKASLDPYLMMWSGDTVRVDRIARGSIVIDKPALTIGVTVQPTVLEALADRPELKGRGVTARFMYSVPKSNVGYRDMSAEADLDPIIVNRYQTAIVNLWRTLDKHETPLRLTLHADAKTAFVDWRTEMEAQRRPGGTLAGLTEWSTKVESSVARLAGLLHLANDPADDIIDGETMVRALTVGEYWIEHARAVHEMWGADPVASVARKILNWITSTEATDFSLRDCYNANRLAMPKAEDSLEPLALLIERGWIRPDFTGPLSVGKRGVPSPRFVVRPDFSSHVRNNHAVMRFMRLETKKGFNSLSFSTHQNKRPPTHEPHEPHDPPETAEQADNPNPPQNVTPNTVIDPNTGQTINLDSAW